MWPTTCVGLWTDNYVDVVAFYTAITNALKVSPEPVETSDGRVTNFGNFLAIREHHAVTTNAEIVLIARERSYVDDAYSATDKPSDPPKDVAPLDGGPASYQWSVQDDAGNTVRVVYLEPS